MTPEFQVNLYRDMLRLRVVEECIAELYPEQEMRCPVHLYTGQEAIAVGVSAALTVDDSVLSGHRSHGHYLAKGGNLKSMVAEIYGRVTGCSKGNGGSMHLVDLSVSFLGAAPIIGSTIPIAVGAGLSASMRGENTVSVVYFGDSACETGVLHESMNYASLHKLPVIFVCENNLYSVNSPLEERQPSNREIFRVASSHNIIAQQGDGNNVRNVHQIMAEAVARARNGDGPTFLEFQTYRWHEHVGPNFDDDIGYRTELEIQNWRKKCPVKSFGKHLIEYDFMTENEAKEFELNFVTEMHEAIKYAKKSPYPLPEQISQHLYASS